jgi:hypothetical protein
VRRTKARLAGAAFIAAAVAAIGFGPPASAAHLSTAASAGTACAAGEKLIAPSGHTTDALGVIRYTYKALPGMVSIVPPRGLTAARATPQLLTDLGEPTSGPAATSFRHGLAHEATAVPDYCLSPAFSHGMPASSTQHAKPQIGTPTKPPNMSGIWAGYQTTYQQFGHGILAASGQFKITSVAPPTAPALPAEQDTWVGVGNGPDPAGNPVGLIQDGVDVATNSSGVETIQSWVEGIGPTCTPTNSPKYCAITLEAKEDPLKGDVIEADVYWPNHTQACWDVLDLSAQDQGNLNRDIDLCDTVPAPFDDTAAEWISENQLRASRYFQNVGTIQWTNMKLSQSNSDNGPWFSPFWSNFTPINMVTAAYSTAGGSQNKIKTCPAGQTIAMAEKAGGVEAPNYGSAEIATIHISGCVT